MACVAAYYGDDTDRKNLCIRRKPHHFHSVHHKSLKEWSGIAHETSRHVFTDPILSVQDYIQSLVDFNNLIQTRNHTLVNLHFFISLQLEAFVRIILKYYWEAWGNPRKTDKYLTHCKAIWLEIWNSLLVCYLSNVIQRWQLLVRKIVSCTSKVHFYCTSNIILQHSTALRRWQNRKGLKVVKLILRNILYHVHTRKIMWILPILRG